MADTSNLTDFLKDVADAIKTKKEYPSSTKIPAANFDLEIANINTLKGEQITVSPLTSQQVITPSANKNAITQVTVNAVTSAIDSNITANNIKMGVNILGVEGNLEPDKPDQTKTVDPAITVQNITPDVGYELSQVTINAVTSNIDANITANNIKLGVNILGVTGNYQGTVINNQDKSVNPSISQIVVGADSGYTGLGQVTVNAVTSNIDNNITAENIKNGVTILNIAGNYTSDATALAKHIKYGETAYVNGSKITGTAIDYSTTGSPKGLVGTTDNISYEDDMMMGPQVSVTMGPYPWTDGAWMDQTTTITAAVPAYVARNSFVITADVIKDGVNILGITGNYTGGGSTENLENVISEQENIIANLSNIVNSKAGVGFIVPNGLKFAYTTYNEFPNTWDFSEVQDMSYMFHNCNNLSSVPNLDMSNTVNLTYTFANCTNLTSVPNFDTSNVTDMTYMFFNSSNITSVPNFDTSNVTNILGVFRACTNLTSVPNFDTSNVIDMGSMFLNCRNLTSVPNFNTSNVTDMNSMFYECVNLTSLPSIDMTNSTDIGYLCFNCINLVDVPEFYAPNTNTVSGMFYRCNNLSDASIQNIINMCLNANSVWSWGKNVSSEVFRSTNIANTRYQNRWAELDAAGWTY